MTDKVVSVRMPEELVREIEGLVGFKSEVVRTATAAYVAGFKASEAHRRFYAKLVAYLEALPEGFAMKRRREVVDVESARKEMIEFKETYQMIPDDTLVAYDVIVSKCREGGELIAGVELRKVYLRFNETGIGDTFVEWPVGIWSLTVRKRPAYPASSRHDFCITTRGTIDEKLISVVEDLLGL